MNKEAIDIPGVVVEFLEVAIHTLLYSRKLYPEGIFALKRKFGVPVHVSQHPQLNQYITDTLLAVKHLIGNQELKQIDICFFNDKSQPIERFVFYLKHILTAQSTNSLSDSYLIQLKESFRAYCLKMSVNSNYMKPLPQGSTFKIFLHTTEESSVLMNEDVRFQEFPWIEAEQRDILIEEPHIIPVRNIESELINMQIYSEESPILKSSDALLDSDSIQLSLATLVSSIPMDMVYFNRDRLLAELKNDKTARDLLQEDNRKYDVEIKKLEKELQKLQKEDPSNDKMQHLDCEKHRKYLEQTKFKESLRRQLAVDRERLRIMIEARTDITEMNVDTLSQAELIRIVKQLERRKVDAASKLQQTENSLDTTAKEVVKLQDALKMYQTEMELRDRKRGLTRMQQPK